MISMIHQWKSLFFTALKVVTLPFYEVLDGKVPFFKTAGTGSPVQNAVRKLKLYTTEKINGKHDDNMMTTENLSFFFGGAIIMN